MAPLTPVGAFTAWEFAPLVSGVLTLFAVAYLAAVWLAAGRAGMMQFGNGCGSLREGL